MRKGSTAERIRGLNCTPCEPHVTKVNGLDEAPIPLSLTVRDKRLASLGLERPAM
jgi:hypothetical protein